MQRPWRFRESDAASAVVGRVGSHTAVLGFIQVDTESAMVLAGSVDGHGIQTESVWSNVRTINRRNEDIEMRRVFIAIALMACGIVPAAAGSFGHGHFWGGGHGLGLGHGVGHGFGMGHGLGFGFGFGHHGFGMFHGDLTGERLQNRFEDRFDDLMEDFEDGLAEDECFFESDDFNEIVCDLETLVTRHDYYVDRLEHSVDRLCDVIDCANDGRMRYEDLLATFQELDHLPDRALTHIEDYFSSKIDRIDSRIEHLTEKKTNLNDVLTTVTEFNDGLSNYLDEITAEMLPCDEEGGEEPMLAPAIASSGAEPLLASAVASLGNEPILASAAMSSHDEPLLPPVVMSSGDEPFFASAVSSLTEPATAAERLTSTAASLVTSASAIPTIAMAASVPEPSAWILFAVPAVVGLLRSRIRRR